MTDQTTETARALLPPSQGPEYTPCACTHIEPEHEPNRGECYSCDCTAYRPTLIVPLPPAGQPTPLRDRIAAAMARADGWAAAAETLHTMDTPAADRYRRCADAVLADLPRRTAGDVAAVIGPTMLLGLQDAELDGEGGTQRIHDWIKWISEAVAALPAVLPATTNHDTDTAKLAATFREVLDTFSPMRDVYGGPISYYDRSADITPAQYEGWRAVLDGALRRVADETAATETDAEPTAEEIARDHVTTLHLIGEQLSTIEGWFWEHLADVREAKQPAAGARQDGERP